MTSSSTSDIETLLAEYGSDEDGELSLAGLNLEDILREAEDGDDEDDGHDLEGLRHHLNRGNHHQLASSSSPPSLSAETTIREKDLLLAIGGGRAGEDDVEKDHDGRDLDDWHRLQAILKDAEMNDDSDHEDVEDKAGFSDLRKGGSDSNHHQDIDRILSSLDGLDDDIDEGGQHQQQQVATDRRTTIPSSSSSSVPIASSKRGTRGGDMEGAAALMLSPPDLEIQGEEDGLASMLSIGRSSSTDGPASEIRPNISAASNTALSTAGTSPSSSFFLPDAQSAATAAAAARGGGGGGGGSSTPSTSGSSSSSSYLRALASLRENRPMGSLRGVELAEVREQKFLRGGNRDLLSPLQVKRRLRPTFLSSSGSSKGGGWGGGGMVRTEVLDAISKQLVKNSQYVSHGPGVPTAVAIHPKFIAIGTKRGLVLLFDHFHAVRNVLGSTSEADVDGAVTSLDMSKTHDILVTGYSSGKVSLWDTLKGHALKAVTDAHASPLINVRFAATKEPSVISVDVLGHVNKINFSKMLWGAWVADTECLLDGKAGPIPSMSILPPSPPPTPSPLIDKKTTTTSLTDRPSSPSSSSSSSTNPPPLSSIPSLSSTSSSSSFSLPLNSFSRVSSVVVNAASSASTSVASATSSSSNSKQPHFSLIAFSSERSSFVVSVEPTVKVLHKWERPPLQSSQQQQQQQELTSPISPSILPSASSSTTTPAPCIAWTWMLEKQLLPVPAASGGDKVRGEGKQQIQQQQQQLIWSPILARVWGTHVQLLRVKMPGPKATNDSASSSSVPTYELAADIVLTANLLAVDWIGGSSNSSSNSYPTSSSNSSNSSSNSTSNPCSFLAVLDAANHLRVLEAPSLIPHDVIDLTAMQLLVLSFTPTGLVGEGEERITKTSSSKTVMIKRASPITPFSPPSSSLLKNKGPLETYQNSFRQGGGGASSGNDDRLYLLGKKELRVVGLQSWSQRVEALIQSGDWLEALALALDYYESEVVPRKNSMEKANNNKATSSSSYSDLPSNPPAMLTLAEGQLAEFLDRYLQLALENAPKGGASTASSLSRSHFQMLAGVCAEYCLVTQRLDRLYGEDVFTKFVEAGQARTFLDTLEPYILTERLRYVAPEVLASLLEHCLEDRNDAATAERCVLHLDVRSGLDYNHILTLLRRHRLWSGLVHVYTRGLKDYLQPLQIFLQELVVLAADWVHRERAIESIVAIDEGKGKGKAGGPSPPSPATIESLGLKLLLYLQYTFALPSPKAFPSGKTLSEADLALLLTPGSRSSVLNLLLQELPPVLPPDAFIPACDIQALGTYPALRLLFAIDAKATLDFIALAFQAQDVVYEEGDPPLLDKELGLTSPGRGSTQAIEGPITYLSTSLPTYLQAQDVVYEEEDPSFSGKEVGLTSPRRESTHAIEGGEEKGAIFALSTSSSSSTSAAVGLTNSAVPSYPSKDRVCLILVSIISPSLAPPPVSICPSSFSSTSSINISNSSPFLSKAQSPDALVALLDLLASLMERGLITTFPHHPAIVDAVLRHLASKESLARLGREACQERMTKVLQRLPPSQLVGSEEAGEEGEEEALVVKGGARGGKGSSSAASSSLLLLPLVREHGFTRAELFLQEAALEKGLRKAAKAVALALMTPPSPEEEGSSSPLPKGAQSPTNNTTPSPLRNVALRTSRTAVLHLAAAIRCYLADSDEEFQKRVFEYLAGVVATVQSIGRQALLEVSGGSTSAVASTPATGRRGLAESTARGAYYSSTSQLQQQQQRGKELMTMGSSSPSSSRTGVVGGQNTGLLDSILLSEVKRVILEEMPSLFQRDKLAFLRLTAPLFSNDTKAILESLEASGNRELQFQYLQAIIAGESQASPSTTTTTSTTTEAAVDYLMPPSVGSANSSGGAGGIVLTPQDLLLYVRLMASFCPDQVYDYLSTHDNYPLDECLRICQQDRRLLDATAFLLERTGDIVGALHMLLTAITERAASLRSVLRRLNPRDFTSFLTAVQGGNKSSSSSSGSRSTSSTSSGKQGGVGGRPSSTVPLTAAQLRKRGLIRKVVLERFKEGKDLEKMLLVAVDLCQRNSSPINTAGSTSPSSSSSGVTSSSSNNANAAAAGAGGRGRVRSISAGGGSSSGGSGGREGQGGSRLWFALLDRLLHEKVASKAQASSSIGLISSNTGSTTSSSSILLSPEPTPAAVIMQAVLNELIQTTLDRMMSGSYVPLPDIVRKLTAQDHQAAANTLGDFRDILLSMFETYSYEKNIYSTGVSLMANTLYRLVKEKKRLKGAGRCVRWIEGSSSPSSSSSLQSLARENGGRGTWPLPKGSETRVLSVSPTGVAYLLDDDDDSEPQQQQK